MTFKKIHRGVWASHFYSIVIPKKVTSIKIFIFFRSTNRGSRVRLVKRTRRGFFPLYYYEGAPQSVEFQAVFGLLGGFKKNAQVLRWHAALLVGYKYIKDAYTDHYVLPLWYHSRYRSEVSTSFETYIPILLSKFSNDDNGARVQRILVLGLLYYYNSEREKFYQREHLLLGTLYYHNKKYERAADGHPRHFDSYGSLWGLLWHYETEENYKRFSILTFVYTRTERDGNVRHRVMGVSF